MVTEITVSLPRAIRSAYALACLMFSAEIVREKPEANSTLYFFITLFFAFRLINQIYGGKLTLSKFFGNYFKNRVQIRETSIFT